MRRKDRWTRIFKSTRCGKGITTCMYRKRTRTDTIPDGWKTLKWKYMSIWSSRSASSCLHSCIHIRLNRWDILIYTVHSTHAHAVLWMVCIVHESVLWLWTNRLYCWEWERDFFFQNECEMVVASLRILLKTKRPAQFDEHRSMALFWWWQCVLFACDVCALCLFSGRISFSRIEFN